MFQKNKENQKGDYHLNMCSFKDNKALENNKKIKTVNKEEHKGFFRKSNN